MAKGTIAKQNAVAIMKEAFGEHWLGDNNSKYYIEIDDGGELTQLAITLTCPKNPVAMNVPIVNGGFDFSGAAPIATQFTPVEFTEEEEANIQRLKEKFNL